MGALTDALILASLQDPVPAARLECTAAQSIATSTTTQVGMNQVAFDTSGSAIADATNDWLLCNRTGIWLISAYLRFANVNSTAERNIFIGVNGSGTRIGSTNANINSAGQALSVSSIYRLGVGDTVALWAWQATGAALNTDASLGNTFLAAVYLGAG